MANLKEIRNRIASVASTMQITSAMKMVSAAKLKKAQDAITAMRPYANKLNELLKNLSASLDGDAGSIYTTQRPVNKVLIVAISSNRGLCGAFNSNIVKQCQLFYEQYSESASVNFIALGKKAGDGLARKFTVARPETDIYENLNFQNVTPLADKFTTSFLEGEYDRIILVYNRFKNAATQIVQSESFLPLEPSEADDTTSSADYIFEPSQQEIVETLIPKSLRMQLFKALRDSFASEHGARMTAMHKATDNAGNLKDELTLNYNKARQAAITSEILEIVGGAEALNG